MNAPNLDNFRRWLLEQFSMREMQLPTGRYRQADLAVDTGISTSAISDWFQKLKPPSYESIIFLALWAEVDPRDIYAVLEIDEPENYDPLDYSMIKAYMPLPRNEKLKTLKEVVSLGSQYATATDKKRVGSSEKLSKPSKPKR